MRRRITVAMLVAGMTMGLAPAAFAPTAVESVRGHWAGFYRGLENPTTSGPFTLDVSSQTGRRFTGEVRGIIDDNKVPVEGSIAESGEMSMVGKSSRGKNLTIEGAIIDDNKRGLFEGRYGITLADGGRRKGDVVAVHQVPDSDSPSFAGGWAGSAIIDDNKTPVDGSFTQEARGAVAGNLNWHPPVNYRFGISGQAGGDGEGGLLLVGGTQDALIVAAVDAFRTSSGVRLEGSYRMIKEVDRTEDGSITLAPSDSGSPSSGPA